MDWESALGPLLSGLGLELYDAEFSGGTLHVAVSRPGGVDLETVTAANRAVSAWLDENDPIAGRFTLDVSSPGLERKLRTPAHYAGAVGEVVTLRERREGEPTRRLEGVLVASDATSATIDDTERGVTRVALDAVERAHTVFSWGAEKRSSGAARTATSKKG